jgi:type IV pilus assembly protein PilP
MTVSAKHWQRMGLVAFILIFSCAMGFAATSPEPKERIELGAEGKSIQEEPSKQEEYTYIPGERRDPFVSLLERGVEPGGEEDELTPLQRVSISELQLVGIIKDPEGNRALIQTPDGRGYFLRVGVQVGKNNGIVEKILADRVVIREKKADFLGQINVSEEVLELKKEEGNR